MEKPFGEDLDSALELNRLLADLVPESAVFRVDLAGQIGDHQIPAYVDEEGVNPRHGTETFAELELELDNWRWPGTVFRLRTGKALGRDRKEVAVHFRSVPHLPFGHSGEALPNVLRFGLDPESLTVPRAQDPGRTVELASREPQPRHAAANGTAAGSDAAGSLP